MLLCTKIKLEVGEQDAATLEFMQSKCRGLYNWWVMRLRDGEKWSLYEAKKSLQESKQHDPELAQVYGTSCCMKSTSAWMGLCTRFFDVSK